MRQMMSMFEARSMMRDYATLSPPCYSGDALIAAEMPIQQWQSDSHYEAAAPRKAFTRSAQIYKVYL